MKAACIVLLPAFVFVCAVGLAFPAPAPAGADADLVQVLKGEVPGLSGRVTGSDFGYFGNALRARFQNETGGPLTVHIPVGVRFVPANAAVQTMYSAGGETVTVPPGASEVVFKGFCGEAHDTGPGGEDVFTPDGSAEGDLLRTLQRINRNKAFNFDGQLAVWHRTDGYDTSGNPRATDLAGGDAVPSSRAAAAGLAGVAAAGGAAAVLARKRGMKTPPFQSPADGTPATDEEPFDPNDFPDIDYGPSAPDESDLIVPDDYVETPPPDEDLFPPVNDEDEAPPDEDSFPPAVETPPPGDTSHAPPPTPESPPDEDDADKAKSVLERVLDLLGPETPPPEEPDPSTLDKDTVEKIENTLGAEGNLRRGLRDALYRDASTNPDQQRQMQREIAQETVQQVDIEDSLELMRVMRALMQTTMTGAQKVNQLYKWLEGAITGVYDKRLPDFTEMGPQGMLSQRGVKGLYNDYRGTYSWTESLSAHTPRNREEVWQELKKAVDQRMEMELSWPEDAGPETYNDPDYQRVQRRIDILNQLDKAFDYEPKPRLNLD